MARKKNGEEITREVPVLGNEASRSDTRPTVEVNIVPEEIERLAAEEREVTGRELAKARETIESKRRKDEPSLQPGEEELFGAFADQRTSQNTIALTAEQAPVAAEAVVRTKQENRFSPPSLAIGAKTATEYDSRARNFSSRTKIVELPDRKKAFLVHNYPMSWIHREMDAFGKWTAGARMRKAKSADWKKSFEEKSIIPIIESADPDTVLMPYLPNVNAHDYFSFNHELKDLGSVPLEKEAGAEVKLALAERIVDELAVQHAKGTAWGEMILHNVIITENGRPLIVDPEVRYNKDVPLVEQKARDVRDLIFSVTGALRRGEKEVDAKAVAERIIDRHPDPAVRAEVIRLAKEKPSVFRKLFRPIHELPRLQISGKDYQAVLDAVARLEAEP